MGQVIKPFSRASVHLSVCLSALSRSHFFDWFARKVAQKYKIAKVRTKSWAQRWTMR